MDSREIVLHILIKDVWILEKRGAVVAPPDHSATMTE